MLFLGMSNFLFSLPNFFFIRLICFGFEVGGGSCSIVGSIKVSLPLLGFSWQGFGGGLRAGLGAGISLRAGIGLGGGISLRAGVGFGFGGGLRAGVGRRLF